MRMIPKILTGLFLVLVTGSGAMAKSVLEKPIYNPETKSYFELVDGSYLNGGQGPNWEEAGKIASKKYLGKAQGRLGILPSAKTEMFVRLSLRPYTNMWIGLYYDCGSKSLIWVDGRTLRSSDYSNWDPSGWYSGHPGMFCAPNIGSRMPVFIGMTAEQRNWLVQLPAKRWHLVLVEYPTGGPLGSEQGRGLNVPESGKAPANLPEKLTEKPAPSSAAVTAPAAPAISQPVIEEPKPIVELKADRLPPGVGLPLYDPSLDQAAKP